MNGEINFDRVLLKERAKEIIKEDYWKCFLAALVLSFALNGSDILKIDHTVEVASGGFAAQLFYNHSILGALFFLPILIFFALLGSAVVLVIGKLIEAPLEVSGKRFFLEASQRRFDLGNLGFGFTGNFFNVFKTILIRDVFVFLWGLLLIIPGIVKHYSYSMVSSILAENPDMDYKRALKLSEDMTNGFKMDLFVMDLSFLGWLFLGALLFGIGTFFVLPYIDAANTEAYLFLRARALDLGIVNIRELSR